MMRQRQYLDALIVSYVTHMDRVEYGSDAFLTMLTEVRRLEGLQRAAGVIPYRDSSKAAS